MEMSEIKNKGEMNQTDSLKKEEVAKVSEADNTEIATSPDNKGEDVKREHPITPKEAVKPKTQVTVRKEETKLTNQELATLDYSEFNTPGRMLALGKALYKSNLVPLATPEDVAVALMAGNELGLPLVTSLSSIYPINNRPTLGVHLQKGLLLSAGVVYSKIEDYVPIYMFVKTNEDGTVVKDSNDKPVIIGKGKAEEKPKNAKKSTKPIDYRTTYEFNRLIKRPNGTWTEMTLKSSFSWSDAVQAELTDKDNYKHYPQRMLDARAFCIGAREIASDVTGGLYSPSEISDAVIINEAGEEIPYEEVK